MLLFRKLTYELCALTYELWAKRLTCFPEAVT
jgi:hypothetical protein